LNNRFCPTPADYSTEIWAPATNLSLSRPPIDWWVDDRPGPGQIDYAPTNRLIAIPKWIAGGEFSRAARRLQGLLQVFYSRSIQPSGPAPAAGRTKRPQQLVAVQNPWPDDQTAIVSRWVVATAICAGVPAPDTDMVQEAGWWTRCSTDMQLQVAKAQQVMDTVTGQTEPRSIRPSETYRRLTADTNPSKPASPTWRREGNWFRPRGLNR